MGYTIHWNRKRGIYMINATKYTKIMILADDMLRDFGNRFVVVASRAYKGKEDDGIPAGSTFTLQVLEDHAAPIIDKKTNMPMDNNVYQTFDVTIPGLKYPSGLVKGDIVSLGKFLPEISYYINYNLILRFGEIKKIQKTQSASASGGNPVTR